MGRKWYVALLWVCCALMVPSASVQGAYEVGDHVNDFTLNDAYGNPVSLYDYMGTVVLINFWTSG